MTEGFVGACVINDLHPVKERYRQISFDRLTLLYALRGSGFVLLSRDRPTHAANNCKHKYDC